MNKKIYILTYHCAMNVGAILQCYALYETIKSMGYNVEVIDFRPSLVAHQDIIDYISLSNVALFKYRLKNVIKFLFRVLKYGLDRNKHIYIYNKDIVQSFGDFLKKNIKLTEKVFIKKEELKYFSKINAVYITGSDQVWNPLLSGELNAYLLDFVENGTKNSYAASFGNNDLAKENAQIFQKALNDYTSITVREQSGVELLAGICNKPVFGVLDPVFLLSKEKWNKRCIKTKLKLPYVFVYRMEENHKFNEVLQKLKEERPELKILKFDSLKNNIGADYTIPNAGPAEFISYIFDCEYVVTNSFHGTAFSVIGNKPGFIIPHTKYNERINSLAELCDMVLIDGVYNLEPKNIDKFKENKVKSLTMLENICKGYSL